MIKEIVVLGAGKIGRGSVGKFFTESGWKVAFYGHTPSKMAALKEQGYYTCRTESGVETRVEGFEVLDCATDDELVERLSRINLCAVAAYEPAFPGMATSIGKAVRARSDAGYEEPLNVMLCVNAPSAFDTFDTTIRAMLDEAQTAYYERQVGICFVMVESLGANPPAGENPWLVLTSDEPHLEVDGDPWKGERVDVVHVSYVSRGLALMFRKVFTVNMSHAMWAFMGHARGQEFMDDGILESRWALWHNDEAFREALFGVSQAFEFDPDELHRFATEGRALTRRHWGVPNPDGTRNPGDPAPSHDPFSRIGNSPRKKLSRDNRFVWPMLRCLEHGVLPVNIALGAAYGLMFLCDTEGIARPANREEVVALVEEVCGLGAEDFVLRDLIVASYLEIPEAGLAPARD